MGILALLQNYYLGPHLVFRIYMVFNVLARSRRRVLPIYIFASKQGAIVVESITKCMISDWKFNGKSDGNIHILVQSLKVGRCLSFYVSMSSVHVSFPIYDYPNIFEVRRNIMRIYMQRKS